MALLAWAYFIACFILWSGWRMFLPGADTPFGSGVGPIPIHSRENIYFQTGRLIYFTAPILVGWGIGLSASLRCDRHGKSEWVRDLVDY